MDTSMGLTPLAGLVMGTRTGDIDPGIIFHLAREAQMSIDEIDVLLNKKSGVKGLAGVNDFRALREMIDDGNSDAWLAYNIYIHQLRRFIGSYMIIDRKSTRLNSSHVASSYAVYCLKKKKNNCKRSRSMRAGDT